MINTKIIKAILPIEDDNITIRLVNYYDIDWYIDNIRSEYYYKYMQSNFSLTSKTAFRTHFLNIITDCISGSDAWCIRLIMLDNNEKIGGCSIFNHKNTDDYELGYFIIPLYQNKGYGYKLLNTITHSIINNITNINLILDIHNNNKASIKIAEKVGYKRYSEDMHYSKYIIGIQQPLC